MEKTLKQKWVNALRSGEYTQCQGKLATADEDGARLSYCCLGVLCDISEKGRWDGANYILDRELWLGETYKSDNEWLDKELGLARQAFGLSQPQESHLIALNDGRSSGAETIRIHSFNEIADWIEANL